MRIYLILGLLISSLLTSCIAMVIAGAAGMVVYDKRHLSVIESDTRIFHVIHTALVIDSRFANSRIEVVSFNQVVLLVGQVPVASLRLTAEKIAQNTSAVRRVYNELTVGNPLNFSTSTKDALVTAQVRSQMLNQKGLESGSIRIVTEAGIVYLMGIVTHEQANLAVYVARQVKDVQKVVKVFQYIT